MRYSPSSDEKVRLLKLVSGLVTTTCAFTTIACELSRTVPKIEPVTSARPFDAKQRKINRADENLVPIMKPSPVKRLVKAAVAGNCLRSATQKSRQMTGKVF